MLHKFFFTGLILVLMPESHEQIYFGVVGCFASFVLLMLASPYRHPSCNHVHKTALLQLVRQLWSRSFGLWIISSLLLPSIYAALGRSRRGPWIETALRSSSRTCLLTCS